MEGELGLAGLVGVFLLVLAGIAIAEVDAVGVLLVDDLFLHLHCLNTY
jgi:hypothetical protein